MSLIALDWGQRFVGYASADPDGLVITPRTHFERKASKENTWRLLAADQIVLEKIIEDWDASLLILGLPLQANGEASDASRGAEQLAEELRTQFNIQVELVDERLTSWEAKGKNNHAQAAALILQNYFLNRKAK